MNPTTTFGWQIVAVGLVIAAIGLIWAVMPGGLLLGRLPGDIRIERGNFRFYFPVVTCIALSALLTLALWLVQLVRR